MMVAHEPENDKMDEINACVMNNMHQTLIKILFLAVSLHITKTGKQVKMSKSG